MPIVGGARDRNQTEQNHTSRQQQPHISALQFEPVFNAVAQ
jgi:hypothetical protein